MQEQGLEGIDRIEEGPSTITLWAHAHTLRTEAEQQVLWQKLDHYVALVRSPEFRERWGTRPGMILLRTPEPPQDAVARELRRRGVDVDIGPVPAASAESSQAVQQASCQLCGAERPEHTMSMTDRGLACAQCFSRWDDQQKALMDAQFPADGRLKRGDEGSTRAWIWVAVVLSMSLLRLCH